MQLLQRASLILVNHQQVLLLIQRFQTIDIIGFSPSVVLKLESSLLKLRKEKRWKKPHWDSIGSKRFLSSKTKVA